MEKILASVSVLVFSLMASFSSAGSARASMNYPELCHERVVELKGEGNFKEICSQIQTPEAYRCITTAISTEYVQEASGWMIDFRLGRSTFYACKDVTSQAIRIVEMLIQKHPDVSSDLIATVGRSTSATQLECFEKLVTQDRLEVDDKTIQSICSK